MIFLSGCQIKRFCRRRVQIPSSSSIRLRKRELQEELPSDPIQLFQKHRVSPANALVPSFVVVPLFLTFHSNRYAFLNGFSGQVIYNQVIIQFFNILFASAPIVVYAVFDSEIDAKELMREAFYYMQGPKSIFMKII